jgi:hypothetical protein
MARGLWVEWRVLQTGVWRRWRWEALQNLSNPAVWHPFGAESRTTTLGALNSKFPICQTDVKVTLRLRLCPSIINRSFVRVARKN